MLPGKSDIVFQKYKKGISIIMKKLRLYVDTSVFGGLFDTESTKRVNTAKQFFQSFNKGVYEGFVSLLTHGQYQCAKID